eukprot:CAMPEP_0197340574 /NCGR_PEP_ID=MMETSP0892-20130614/45743_1 /TAXON_ID=44058 ORGANISM="Aureoumbra lagunensis, Strain CCMP1510" /NCGR_SAMPLE_ID=MMETSP0892 /ASSEMBLY_ACC=CAM_ASM_000538 /LENGTH=301 /DNA_ID=CAMNT_0042845331 /DNA_START=94 /DNA_END=999 /DNA_ORIENTATION=-
MKIVAVIAMLLGLVTAIRFDAKSLVGPAKPLKEVLRTGLAAVVLLSAAPSSSEVLEPLAGRIKTYEMVKKKEADSTVARFGTGLAAVVLLSAAPSSSEVLEPLAGGIKTYDMVKKKEVDSTVARPVAVVTDEQQRQFDADVKAKIEKYSKPVTFGEFDDFKNEVNQRFDKVYQKLDGLYIFNVFMIYFFTAYSANEDRRLKDEQHRQLDADVKAKIEKYSKPVTFGEFDERLDKVEREVDANFRKVDAKLDALDFKSNGLYLVMIVPALEKAYSANEDRRLRREELEKKKNKNNWFWHSDE